MKPYKIDKRIKVPAPSRPKTASTVSRAAITMQVLDVGDSFLVGDSLEAVKAEKSMRDMNAKCRARHDSRHFTSRRLPKGLRIWRIK